MDTTTYGQMLRQLGPDLTMEQPPIFTPSPAPIPGSFGDVFRQALEDAKSGWTSPGGRSDGFCHGIDMDQELAPGVQSRPAPLRSRHTGNWKEDNQYPTNRFDRCVWEIKRILQPTIKKRAVHDTSGW